MATQDDRLQALRDINELAAFNRWANFEVVQADAQGVVLSIAWREEFGQYAGFLHAGMTAALIDTACGFAAVAATGSRVLAAHLSVNFLRPATGKRFIARARVVKPGRAQVFSSCELFAETDQGEKLVATGETLLAVPAEAAQAGG
jgi:uncharacterized protein (TIGR00369 family)